MPNARHRLLALGLLFLLSTRATSADPVDVFGDPLPKGAKLRLGTTRGVFQMYRNVEALPPDYQSIVSIERRDSRDHHPGVVIWDRDTVRVRNRLTPANAIDIETIVASADGKRLAMWHRGVATVWEVATGRLVATINPGSDTPRIGLHPVVSLSRDGKRLAIGGNPIQQPDEADREVAVTVWDADKAERIARLAVRQRGGLAAHLSHDGKTLVTWTVENYDWSPGERPLAPPPRPVPDPFRFIRVWDVASGKEVTRVQMARTQPSSVALSPDGLTVAAVTSEPRSRETPDPDGLIERWDTRTGEAKPPLRVRVGQWRRVLFSPDSRTLATIGMDGIVRRWANADGRLLGETRLPSGTAPTLAFTDNERAIVWETRGSYVSMWEVPSGKLLTTPRENDVQVTAISFSADGKEVVTTGCSPRVTRWDAATGKPIGSVVLQIDLSPYDPFYFLFRKAAISTDTTRVTFQGYRSIVYDTKTGAELFVCPTAFRDGNREYLTTPDLSRVVRLSTSDDRKDQTVLCEVWDVGTRKKLKEFTLPATTEFGEHLINVRGYGDNSLAALSPDGTQLVTLGWTRRPQQVRGQPPAMPSALITAWDLQTGKRLSVTEVPNELPLSGDVVVSDDRGAVYLGNSGLRAVDLDRGHLGSELDKFRSREQFLRHPLTFSPDGKQFAVAIETNDKTYGVRVYDWPRGTVQHTFTGHSKQITAIAFSPDGKTLATGSQDTTVLLWDLNVIGK